MRTRPETGMLLPTSGQLNAQKAGNAEHPQPASAEQGQHGESVAKQMICRNHKAFHNASADSVAAKSPSVKCSLPWMQTYVPGTKESGVDLPEGTLQSCLENLPGRFVWVVKFNKKSIATQKVAKEHQHGTPCRPAVADKDETKKHHNSISTQWGFLYWGTCCCFFCH